MPRETIELETPHRHVDKDWHADWFTVRVGDEPVVINDAGDGGVTTYTLGKTTDNPRVLANADAILWDGFVGLTHYEDGLVTISHRMSGIEDRLPVDVPLDNPVQTLERTETIQLEGDKFPDGVQFTCTDCGDEVDREQNQMDIPGITPSRCASCTFDRMAEQ